MGNLLVNKMYERVIMYCDSCGQKIIYNAKYCRRCGQPLRVSKDDTQPVPIISETMLRSSLRQTPIPWYKSFLPKKPVTHRSRFCNVIYDVATFTFITVLLYILVTFKTIWDYQILTALWGGSVIAYIWWKR